MTPEKLDALERQVARWEEGALGLIDDGTLHDLIAAARREAALREALVNCGIGAHDAEHHHCLPETCPYEPCSSVRALLSEVPQ